MDSRQGGEAASRLEHLVVNLCRLARGLVSWHFSSTCEEIQRFACTVPMHTHTHTHTHTDSGVTAQGQLCRSACATTCSMQSSGLPLQLQMCGGPEVHTHQAMIPERMENGARAPLFILIFRQSSSLPSSNLLSNQCCFLLASS